ncbi:MAG: hypothetical protein MK103_00550 [Planctomycetes bacterium]|nr:hypothetical protein [Planctomycetota bacterium]
MIDSLLLSHTMGFCLLSAFNSPWDPSHSELLLQTSSESGSELKVQIDREPPVPDVTDSLIPGIFQPENTAAVYDDPDGNPLQGKRNHLLKNHEPDSVLPKQTKQGNPLIHIGQHMHAVKKRLAESHSGKATQKMQAQIVEDLNNLLSKLESSEQQQASSMQRQPPSPSQKPEKPQNSTSQKTPSQTSQSAKQAGQTAAAEHIQRNSSRALLKAIWGHLPDRLREQLEQRADLVFLPQYELLIESYFEALLDKNTSSPQPPSR